MSSQSPATSFKRKRRQLIPEADVDNDGFHPFSNWQEEAREDNLPLTLYDVHRKPRPVLWGRIQRPLKELRSEFRCVICLGYIRNTRVVMECLHRFCDECIGMALRLGRKECPMCKAPIPTRRSVAADPNFDDLLQSIMGDLVENGEDVVQRNEFPDVSQASKKQPARREDPTVEILLSPVKNSNLKELEYPYLRLNSAATVSVLLTYLKRKMDHPNHQNFQLFSVVQSRGARNVPVEETTVLATLMSIERQGCVQLYYAKKS
jgi:hypothetical protein